MFADEYHLCADLDRTLLPNGLAKESPEARRLFSVIARQPNVSLTYLTGRDVHRALRAIDQYDLPLPDFLITDVGSSLYDCRLTDEPVLVDEWSERLRQDWRGENSDSLMQKLAGVPGLAPQCGLPRTELKLSFNVEINEMDRALSALRVRLMELGIQASVISSTEEVLGVGMIDVLPPSANKKLALDWLVQHVKWHRSRVFFAGDSGNDIDVLLSPYPAVLVANAEQHLKDRLMEAARVRVCADNLYVASGQLPAELPSMNGNYAAGVVEGFLHFFPENLSWFRARDSLSVAS